MIFPFQRPAFDSLILTAKAAKLSTFFKLPARPRFHRLIVGPTGSGKTHLAQALASKMGWPCIKINASSWIVLGARETPTWQTLQGWASSFEDEAIPNTVIVLDELDKIWGMDQWTRNCRSEIFDLMDGQAPAQIITKELEAVLGKALIVGCGAFQDAYETPPTVGFNPKSQEPASLGDLARHLPREILNRFQNEVLILPNLKERDYYDMMHTAARGLPELVAEEFKRHAAIALKKAVEDKTAARFVETVLGNMLIESAAEDENWEAPALTGPEMQ